MFLNPCSNIRVLYYRTFVWIIVYSYGIDSGGGSSSFAAAQSYERSVANYNGVAHVAGKADDDVIFRDY